jgi:hypothetical protein
MAVELKLISKCNKGLYIAPTADDLNDNIQLNITDSSFSIIWGQWHLLLLIRDRNQLCESSAELGVKVDLNATIIYQKLTFYLVLRIIFLGDTVQLCCILRPTILGPSSGLQYGIPWGWIFFHENFGTQSVTVKCEDSVWK